MTHAVERPDSVGMSARRLERVRPAMQAYVDRGVYAGVSTLIARRGSPRHAECRAIANAVRDQQRREGFLGGQDHAVTRSGKLKLTISQKRDPIGYHVGESSSLDHWIWIHALYASSMLFRPASSA